MSLQKIRPIVKQFVTGHGSFGGPGVLVIKGQWGVGKTHFWKNLINEEIGAGRLENEGYVYCSLFGLDSLAEVKTRLWSQRKNLSRLKKAYDPDSYWICRAWHRSVYWLSGLWKDRTNLSDLSRQLRKIRKYGAGISLQIASTIAYPTFINNTLVCIDDLDRMSSGVSMQDLLGLVTQLKDEHDCKVCLILNEDSMGEKEVKTFRTHGEKGVDIKIEFEPSSEESFDLAVSSTNPHYDILRESCLQLGVVNIRGISRIRDAAERLAHYLEERSRQTKRKALRVLVMLIRAYHDSTTAPPFDKIHPFDPRLFLMQGGENVTEEDKKVASLVQEYNYYPSVGLHKAIKVAVQKGYYNDNEIMEALDKLDQEATMDAGRQDYSRAWDLYRDSFDHNEDEFCDTLSDVTRENIANLNLSEFNEAIKMLRSLNRSDDADYLTDEYVDHHYDELGADGLRERKRNILFSSLDPYLNDEMEKAQKIIPEDTSIKACFQRVAAKESASSQDVEALATCSVDDYYNHFKTSSGDFLKQSIRWCLEFRKISNPSSEEAEIARKAEEALKKIGLESPLNRLRVESMYDVEIGAPQE
jgi:ABC-type sugar transport system ATPase subunit